MSTSKSTRPVGPGHYDEKQVWVPATTGEHWFGPIGWCIMIICTVLGFGAGLAYFYLIERLVSGFAIGVLFGVISGLLLGVIAGRVMYLTVYRKMIELVAASSEGNLAVVESLTEEPAMASASSYSGVTPLHVAATPAIVDRLIATGANIEERTLCGWSPLAYSLMDDRTEVTQHLLTKGAKWRIPDVGQIVPATPHLARSAQAIDVLTSAGVDMSERSPVETRTFSNSLLSDWEPVVPHIPTYCVAARQYVQNLRAINDETYSTAPANLSKLEDGKYSFCVGGGATPLHTAVMANRPEVVRALIRHGADVNAADSVGFTPLHHAQTGEMAQMLLEAGASVAARAWCDVTPLHMAVLAFRLSVVPQLLRAGADLHARCAIVSDQHAVCQAVAQAHLDGKTEVEISRFFFDDNGWVFHQLTVKSPHDYYHAAIKILGEIESTFELKGRRTDVSFWEDPDATVPLNPLPLLLQPCALADLKLFRVHALQVMRLGLGMGEELRIRPPTTQMCHGLVESLVKFGGTRFSM